MAVNVHVGPTMGRKVEPNWMGNKAKRRKRVKDSQAQEALVGALGGGRRVRGSGSKPHARGDAVWPEHGIMIEAKRTDGKGIRVTGAMLDRITKEALSNGMEPALALEMPTEFAKRDWIAIPAERLVELLEHVAILETEAETEDV